MTFKRSALSCAVLAGMIGLTGCDDDGLTVTTTPPPPVPAESVLNKTEAHSRPL